MSGCARRWFWLNGGVERLVEHRVRRRRLVGQRHLQLIGQDAEGDGIGSRRGEREIDELEHRLEILAGGAAAEPFLRLADVGPDKRRRAGEDLFQSRVRLRPPRPPCAMTASAVSAGMKSASLASEVPPGLTARNRISSCLNVVGLSTTRTPLDKRHSVMPSASFVEVGRDGSRRREAREQRLRAGPVDVGRQRRADRPQ